MNIVMHSTAFNPADLMNFDEEGYEHLVKQNSLPDLVSSIQRVINPLVLQTGERP